VLFTRTGFDRHFPPAMPTKPSAMIPGFINGDAVNPGLERTLAAECSNIPKNLEKYFLNHIGRVGRIVHQAADHAVDRLFEALD
jgi:hypothetical protein